eukprot:TRINITY_DN38511_c0_g1_i1.p1 TRINITY_DN38511_c0_g1~~TRINITY_DN38511_c0_g1_i1.p1  ORF type:complete len:485 (+),score=73.54 TRINITY_DN38511_c0_g1_i1:90-1544(+)
MSARARTSSPAPVGSGADGGSSSSASVSRVTRVVRKGEDKDGVCKQLCCALVICLLGPMVFAMSLVGIAVNERNSVCVGRALAAADAAALSADCNRQNVAVGDLAHFACPVSEKSLPTWTSRDFGDMWSDMWNSSAFSVKAIKVAQNVQMFQCRERKSTRKETRGQETVEITTWTYERGWYDDVIDSSNFDAWSDRDARDALREGCGKDFARNPTSMAFTSTVKSVKSLIAGSFDATRHTDKISATQVVKIDASELPKGTSASGNELFTCDFAKPTYGCLAATYKKSSATEVSAIAKLTKGKSADLFSLSPWAAPASWMCSSSMSSSQVDLFGEGFKTREDLIADAIAADTLKLYLVRVLCVVFSVVGVMMFLQPIRVIASLVDQFFGWFKVVPLLGGLLEFFGDVVTTAVGCAIFSIALGIGVPTSLCVLSVTWCFMRPMLGVPMLLACIAGLGFTIKQMVKYASKGREKRQDEAKKASNKDE